MKNLFILHTQYNIILGTGIMLNRFRECQNDLIVYAEFTISEEYKNKLEKLYDRVLFVRKQYEPLTTGFWNIERKLNREFSTFKRSSLYNTEYDNVFISQDRPLEHFILGSCKKIKSNCCCFYLEESSYYSLDVRLNDPNRKRQWNTRRPFLYRKLRYGRVYLSEEYKDPLDGEASYFDAIFAIFPDCVRTELAHKVLYEINAEEINEATKVLYDDISVKLPDSSQYVLFFFDLMDRYKNPSAIKDIVEDIVKKSNKDGFAVLLKYHPREVDKFQFERSINIVEVPSIIPAEKLLCDLRGRRVIVYGNATASLMVAQKLGFKVISIAKIDESNNLNMINKFIQMGIEVPNTIEELLK